MTIIARLTQLSLRADFIFYSCENWQIVMSWNSCRARYCSRKSQGQLIQWPAVFGIIPTFMLCSINLSVERLCMMLFFFFFFRKRIASVSLTLSSCLLKFKQEFLLDICFYLSLLKDYIRQATLIQRVNLFFRILF